MIAHFGPNVYILFEFIYYFLHTHTGPFPASCFRRVFKACVTGFRLPLCGI